MPSLVLLTFLSISPLVFGLAGCGGGHSPLHLSSDRLQLGSIVGVERLDHVIRLGPLQERLHRILMCSRALGEHATKFRGAVVHDHSVTGQLAELDIKVLPNVG